MKEESAVRVGIDGRMIDAAGTGVTTYARSLMAAIPLTGHPPVLVAARPRRLDRAGMPRLARLERWAAAARPGARILRQTADGSLVGADIFRTAHVHFDMHRRLMPLRVVGPAGIMHWTYPVPLRLEGWINLYTVHDAIPLVAPALTPIDQRRHARLLGRIAASADALVTVSAAARAEIVAAVGCPPGFVVDCGQPLILPPVTGALPAGLSPGGYMLFCGSIEPRKNLVALAAAYRASKATMPLLVAGPDGWRAAEVARAIGFDGTIRRLPYQSREALVALIAGARALLFPTLAEGFGLPVAEAMALGTPVMTSHAGALAETAGGAALLVDPADGAAMARGIAALAADDALCAMLRQQGLTRAAAFSIERFAARIGALYARMIDRAGSPA